MKTSTEDNKLMTLLKLSEVSRVICDTDKGTLKLRIRKGDTNYHFTLDAVELPKELNKELMELLYAPKVETTPTWNGEPVKPNSKEEKILKSLDPHKSVINIIAREELKAGDLVTTKGEKAVKKKGGRPKGSKNK